MEEEGVTSTDARSFETGITDWIDITRFLEEQERCKEGKEYLWKLPHDALFSRALQAVEFKRQQELYRLSYDFDDMCASGRANVCRVLLGEAEKQVKELTSKRDYILMHNSFRLERKLLAEKEAEREAREKTWPPRLPDTQTLWFTTTPTLSEGVLRTILDWTVDGTGDIRRKHGVTHDEIMCTELGEDNEEVVQLKCCNEAFKCIFNKSTVLEAFKFGNKCPNCGHPYVIPGPQPTGNMQISYDTNHQSCDGHEPFGTMIINYLFPAGIQTERMHKPGNDYDDDSRTVYLPADETGARCAQWLIAAFKQGKLFRVAESKTRNGVYVVWNIHQKTRRNGGYAHHGWPDETTADGPGHLDRLISECTAQNVSLTDLL